MAGEFHRNILICVDGSSHSEKAFSFYVDHLHRRTNRVVTFYAAEPPVYLTPSMPMGIDYTKEYTVLMKSAQTDVEELEKRYAQKMRDLHICGKVKAAFSSKPGEAILHVAREEKAELIVIGTRGMGTVRRTLIGSVSDYIMDHAQCPVVICRHA